MDLGTLRKKIKPNKKSIIKDLQFFLLSDLNEINSYFEGFISVNFVLEKVSTISKVKWSPTLQ